jgi:hypothetical protein
MLAGEVVSEDPRDVSASDMGQRPVAGRQHFPCDFVESGVVTVYANFNAKLANCVSVKLSRARSIRYRFERPSPTGTTSPAIRKGITLRSA